MPNKTSYGCDKINNILLKNLDSPYLKPLEIIFNKSIEYWWSPPLMKLAEVIPLHEGKDHTMLTNYRPISLLVMLSKVVEKLCPIENINICKKWINSINVNMGLEEKHNCEQAIMNLVGKIIQGMNKGQLTIALFLDLLKAFNTLNHNILVNKLDRYGNQRCGQILAN